jgi:hypothetical protein
LVVRGRGSGMICAAGMEDGGGNTVATNDHRSIYAEGLNKQRTHAGNPCLACSLWSNASQSIKNFLYWNAPNPTLKKNTLHNRATEWATIFGLGMPWRRLFNLQLRRPFLSSAHRLPLPKWHDPRWSERWPFMDSELRQRSGTGLFFFLELS